MSLKRSAARYSRRGTRWPRRGECAQRAIGIELLLPLFGQIIRGRGPLGHAGRVGHSRHKIHGLFGAAVVVRLQLLDHQRYHVEGKARSVRFSGCTNQKLDQDRIKKTNPISDRFQKLEYCFTFEVLLQVIYSVNCRFAARVFEHLRHRRINHLQQHRTDICATQN